MLSPQNRLFGVAAILGVLGATSLAHGCANLENVPAGVCGNQIKESGEDCDTAEPYPHTLCRPAGTDGECRYDCLTAQCPSGWSCGGDDLCRKATGDFRLWSDLTTQQSDQVLTADFDGDGAEDLLTTRANTGRVVFLDEAGNQVSSHPLSLGVAPPSIAFLSDDDGADLVVPARNTGIAVLLGQTDRTLLAQTFASTTIDSGEGRLLAVREPTDEGNEGDEIIAFVGTALIHVETDEQVHALAKPLSEIAGEPPLGWLTTDSPCEQLVVAYRGADYVSVLPLCAAEPATWNWDPQQQAPRTVKPDVSIAGDGVGEGVLIAHLNADDHLDLLIAGGRGLHAAFGVGDGTFHSDVTAIPDELGNNSAQLLWEGETRLPLAAGDVTGDETPDFIYPDGVALGDEVLEPGSSCLEADECELMTLDNPGLQQWKRAQVADFDGNGVLDIVAAAQGLAQLDVLLSPGPGLLNAFSIPLPGPAGTFEVGDFDGDLAPDVAVSFPSGKPGQDRVAVLFAEPYGPPAAPWVVGNVDLVEQLLVMDLEFEGNGIEDFVVVSRGDPNARSIAAVLGNSTRRPQAPIKPNEFDEVLGVTVAELTGDEHDDLAVMTFSSEEGLDLWVLPSVGAGELDQDQLARIPLQLSVDWAAAHFIPANLDGTGPQELVVLAPQPAPAVGGAVLVIKNTQGTFSISEMGLTEEVYWSAGSQRDLIRQVYIEHLPEADVFHTSGPSQPGTVVATDVTGDGRDDLVAFAYSSLDVSAEVTMILLPGTADAGVDLAGRRVIPPLLSSDGVELTPRTFAVLEADSDVASELVLVTDQGGFLAELSDDATRLLLLRPLPDINPGIRTVVATGDVTGDGVDDIVAAQGEIIKVLEGIPERR